MRRVVKRSAVLAVFMLFLFCITGTAQQLDSASQSALGAKLAEYFEALKYEPADVQKTEADFLIESTSDSLVRQFVACSIYEHFVDSPIMGTEAVAIHVYDKWFKSGNVKMRNDMDMLNAGIFAEFNRQSQIGMKAPELVMETMDGDTLSLFTRNGRYAEKGDRHSVLFFYDSGCAKCKIESILLRNVLETEDYPIDFYAIYAGTDRSAWETYVADRFDVETSNTSVTHLWDPEIESDFQRKYGVVQTPRMYLIGPDQVIKGRGLDTYAFALMMGDILASPELDYGNPSMDPVFDELVMTYSPSGEKPSSYGIVSAADYIANAPLHAGDTTLCRQMLGDFLYYLAPQTGEGVKEGLGYLIDEYILGRNDIWKSQDDSLKVIGFAQMLDDLLSKSPVQSRIADLKVPGELLRHGKRIRSGEFNLRKLRGGNNVILFYTEGCRICDSEKAAARKLVAENPDWRVLLVNVDSISASDPSLSEKLFDTFDLSTLPFLIQTDRRGRIVRRYITLQ